MKIVRVMRILLTTFCLLIFASVYGADEKPKGGEIILENSRQDLKNRPHAPAYIPIKCYCDGEVLSFVSANSLCGEFMIVDEVSGEVVICAYGCINPDYQIGVSGLSGSFIIYVSIDDSIYSGFLEL